MNDIKGLDTWEGEAKEWSKKSGDLKVRAGTGMVGALENWYAAWLKKPTERNRRETLTWRLRLHLRWNDEPEFLEEINEAFTLGLFDDEVGNTYWEIPAEKSSGFTNGFNWRRDSGNAIKGADACRRRKLQEDLEDSDSDSDS